MPGPQVCGAACRRGRRRAALAAVRRSPTAAGLTLGALLDAMLADPPRGHPVAAFGRAAEHVEAILYRPDPVRGAGYVTACLAAVLLPALALARTGAGRPRLRTATTAAATWVALGGTTLAREATAVGAALAGGDLAAARDLLPRLCGRDPAGLEAPGLARAVVESVAENTSDAVVAPLVWGALAGVPGLVGYRAVNTLDAMVGHRSPRYARFGTAAARLDDLANLVPARLTALLAVLLAPLAGGSCRAAWRTWRADHARHPSPNAGHPEAAFAGALGVRLGGPLAYGGRTELRGHLGRGRPARAADIPRAVRLSRTVAAAALGLAALGAAALDHRR